MRKRAEHVDQTRQRIVDAAIHLHGILGPVATTVAAIAEHAGVTRLTVYRHFPDDETLFAACSAGWRSQRVLPDPHAWTQVDDPAQRVRVGLADLYRFYRDGQSMLTHVHRDMESLPEFIRKAEADDSRRYCEALLQPFAARGAQRRRLRAVLGHATAFSTWRSLCADNELSDAEAVELMARFVVEVGAGTKPARQRS